MIFGSKKPTSLGKRGEESAINYLRKNGYKILEKNFYNAEGRMLGEIDIVAKEKDEIVFIEVKTRSFSKNFLFPPEESVTPAKLRKLSKIASYYMARNNLFNYPYRFDVITIVAEKDKNYASLRHIKNVFI